jgi:hypothetical protein
MHKAPQLGDVNHSWLHTCCHCWYTAPNFQQEHTLGAWTGTDGIAHTHTHTHLPVFFPTYSKPCIRRPCNRWQTLSGSVRQLAMCKCAVPKQQRSQKVADQFHVRSHFPIHSQIHVPHLCQPCTSKRQQCHSQQAVVSTLYSTHT